MKPALDVPLPTSYILVTDVTMHTEVQWKVLYFLSLWISGMILDEYSTWDPNRTRFLSVI